MVNNILSEITFLYSTKAGLRFAYTSPPFMELYWYTVGYCNMLYYTNYLISFYTISEILILNCGMDRFWNLLGVHYAARDNKKNRIVPSQDTYNLQ